uniref:Uncharacterized protein n=1 Tax=Anopheles atroparvus TaxID=41427 RepID=A0AAG5CTB3_ANOAO
MWQKLETWVCFLLSLVLALSCGGAYGLSCNFCQPESNYSSCLQHGGPVECTEALVNVTHLLLVQHVPALRSVSPMPEFQCFQANYTVNGVTNYQMGCTYAESHICEGWAVLSQCKITNGTTTKMPQSYGTPTKPSVGPNSSTPRGSTNFPNNSSSISTTPKVDSNDSTSQVNPTETPGTEGPTATPDR